jgi:hypothetical protein
MIEVDYSVAGSAEQRAAKGGGEKRKSLRSREAWSGGREE